MISTADFTKEIEALQAQFDPSFCFVGAENSIIPQIMQASDIMTDGTQDPGKTCDGILIGLGFDAEPVLLGGDGRAAVPAVPAPVHGGPLPALAGIVLADRGDSSAACGSTAVVRASAGSGG